ncbi:MAG: DUF3332 domain-containing protein [Dysgonamonadaceae bacterium]|jgi:hypothetical protein|nr:DUF3332 domain-containing protein [Dysgonamonadaceae bacterium]
MKRIFFVPLATIMLSACVLFSSCLGSFSLFNRLLSWNRTIDDKFINELIFIALWIVPVYQIAMLADLVVLNSLEFWSDENPLAEGDVRHIKSANGDFTVTVQKDGYHIEKDGTEASFDFRFNHKSRVWSMEINGESTPLLQIGDDKQALMFLPDGTTMTVALNQAGVTAFKQAALTKNLYVYGGNQE